MWRLHLAKNKVIGRGLGRAPLPHALARKYRASVSRRTLGTSGPTTRRPSLAVHTGGGGSGS